MIEYITQYLDNNAELIFYITYGLFILLSAIILLWTTNIKEILKKAYLPFLIFWLIVATVTAESMKTLILMFVSILPLLVLIGLSFKLIFSAYDIYKKNKSKITRQLIIYFVSLLLFISYSFFLIIYFYFKNFEVNQLEIKFFALNLLVIWITLMISSFYTSKIIFFPESQSSKYVEFFLVFLSGVMIGRLASLSNLFVIDFSYYGIPLEVINILADYEILVGIMIIFIVIFSYNIYYTTKTYYKMKKVFEEKNVKIDPVTLPRLKLAVYGTLLFFVLNLSISIVLVSKNLYLSIIFYLLFIISIFLLELSLYLAFQTPSSIKKRWRRKYMSTTISL